MQIKHKKTSARSIFSAACAAALLAGCATTYSLPEKSEKAQLRLLGENASSGTFSRRFFLYVFENEECGITSAGTTLIRLNSSGKDRVMSEAVDIQAGKPATLTAQYIDARFAQNRSCYVTGTFTPLKNETYTVVLAVNPDVTECRMGLFNGSPVEANRVDELHLPSAYCTVDGKFEGKNGKSLWTNWIFY